MSAPDPYEIVCTKLTLNGVEAHTRGALASSFFRSCAVAFLRELDHGEDFYENYRSLKYPGGEASTAASRLLAHDYALKTASLLSIAYAEGG